MKLFIVSDYVGEARILLQDLVFPYRYDDDGLISGLNNALYEIARIRPDILADLKYHTTLPRAARIDDNIPDQFGTDAIAAIVPVPAQYKMAVLYYICGFAQLRDMEDNTDQRAQGFMLKFNMALMTLQG